jgi:hypothetical protein
MIHVSGTLGGKFSRRRTGTADWDEAKSVVALLQQSGSWDGQGPRLFTKSYLASGLN